MIPKCVLCLTQTEPNSSCSVSARNRRQDRSASQRDEGQKEGRGTKHGRMLSVLSISSAEGGTPLNQG